MSTIMNKQQSGLTKKYNRLVKLYNHNKIQLEVCKDTFKEMKNERDHFCYQYAYMIQDYSRALTKISHNIKDIKRRVKKSNKNYQTTHYNY